MVNEGDKYTLHSINGMDYTVEIINVNYCRPPEMFYACDVIDGNGVSFYETQGDWFFCGDDLIDKCERTNESRVLREDK